MDKILEKKKGIQPKHIPYIIGSLLLVVLLGWIIFGNHGQTLRIDKDKLSISKIEEGQFKEYLRLNGQVQPNMVMQLSASEAGRVEEKLIEEGTLVKTGDIIVKLSNPALELEVINSEAQLAEKENSLRNTLIQMQQSRIKLKQELLQHNFDVARRKRRYENNIMLKSSLSHDEFLQSKEDYEYAEMNYKLILEHHEQDSIFGTVQLAQLEQGLKNMKRNLQMVRERLDGLNVKAPIDGQLGMLDVEIGQNISKGQKVGQMTGVSGYKLEVSIDEHYIDRVHTGLPVSMERQESQFPLRIRKIYPEVRQGVFKADLVFMGDMPENIRNGQTYSLQLELGEPVDAIMVPKGSFFQATGGQWIFVLSADGTEAVKRTIRIGRQNPRFYEVIEGLNPGEEVIISGYENFGINTRLILR